MTTDLDALAERRRVGCLLGAASGCVCPSSPPYENCRKRSIDLADRQSASGKLRQAERELDRLRGFAALVAALQPGAGLSDNNLRNLIERAKEALGNE